MSIEALEGIASHQPYRVFRTVKWSECDPAGVVYAANFYGYALWATDAMLLHLLGGARNGVQSPVKSATLTHYSTLKPGERLDLEVTPQRVGTTSYDMLVNGTSERRAVFDALIRVVCTDQAVTSSVPVPEHLRERLLSCLSTIEKKQEQEER